MVNDGGLRSKYISRIVSKIVFSYDKTFLCNENIRYLYLFMRIFLENIELKMFLEIFTFLGILFRNLNQTWDILGDVRNVKNIP